MYGVLHRSYAACAHACSWAQSQVNTTIDTIVVMLQGCLSLDAIPIQHNGLHLRCDASQPSERCMSRTIDQ